MSSLTILIPTLETRKHFLDRLIQVLAPQCKEHSVKIIKHLDKGEKKIGTKRNELLDGCETDYCVFIDDDDLVASDYVERIMEGIKKGVDVVTFKGIITSEGKPPRNIHTQARTKIHSAARHLLSPPKPPQPNENRICKTDRFSRNFIW